jgi:hypothetical protein
MYSEEAMKRRRVCPPDSYAKTFRALNEETENGDSASITAEEAVEKSEEDAPVVRAIQEKSFHFRPTTDEMDLTVGRCMGLCRGLDSVQTEWRRTSQYGRSRLAARP